MKGLLMKDIQLIFGNARMLAILIAISIFMTYTQKGDMLPFICSYLTIVSAMLVLSSISYDTFDHGMAFLLTLPITRRTYVLEKYCFGTACGTVGWIFSLVLTGIIALLGGTVPITMDAITGCLVIYFILMIMLSIMLPIQLKFGAETGRIALVIIIGAIFVISIIGTKIAKTLHIDLDALLDTLTTTLANYFLPAALVAAILALVISYGVSLRIMENKPL